MWLCIVNGEVKLKAISYREALCWQEEFIMDVVEKWQGSLPPNYVNTHTNKTTCTNTVSWYSPRSYGLHVQTYNVPHKYTLWYRNRTVGWLTNSWVDERLYDLDIIYVKKEVILPIHVINSPNTPEGVLIYNQTIASLLLPKEKLPYLEELRESKLLEKVCKKHEV